MNARAMHTRSNMSWTHHQQVQYVVDTPSQKLLMPRCCTLNKQDQGHALGLTRCVSLVCRLLATSTNNAPILSYHL